MSQTERDFHRKLATQCFNETWDYLDKTVRDANDDQRMLHLTHTSRFHWSFVGNARRLVIGDWQISRVYAALKQPELALRATNIYKPGKRNRSIDRLVSGGLTINR